MTFNSISVRGSPYGAIKIVLAVSYKRLAPTGQDAHLFGMLHQNAISPVGGKY